MKNTYEITDFATERDRGVKIDYHFSSGCNIIYNMIENNISGVVIGERGIGKSTSVAVSANKFSNEDKNKHIFSIAGSRQLSDVYNIFWGMIVGHPNEKSICYNEFEEYLTDEYRPMIDMKTWFSSRCKYHNCKRRERCRFILKDNKKPKYDEMMENLFFLTTECPLKRFILQETMKNSSGIFKKLIGSTYIIDFPDTVTKINIDSLNKLIPSLQRTGNVILTLNTKQYELIKSSDIFARIGAYNFPRLTYFELRAIVSAHGEGISDQIADKLIKQCNENPRKLLQLCELYSTGLILNISKNLSDMLHEITKKLKEDGREWVKVDEYRRILKSEYNSIYPNNIIGKSLKINLCLTQKSAPYSQYNVSEYNTE